MSNRETDGAPSPDPVRRRRRWPRRVGIGAGILVLLIAIALGWLLGTGSGLRFALHEASSLSHGALHVQTAGGRLAGEMDLRGINYSNGKGLSAHISRLDTSLRLWALVTGTVHITKLEVGRVQIQLPQNPPRKKGTPLSLQPPLDVILDRAHIGPITVRKGRKTLFKSNSLALGAAWTHKRVTVDHLLLKAPKGSVALNGTIHTKGSYRGQMKGQFHWTQGKTLLTGTLNAHGDGNVAHLALDTSRPMPVHIRVQLHQNPAHRWQAQVKVPAFDPSRFINSRKLHRLAVTLRVHGQDKSARIRGDITVNAHRLHLAPLAVALDAGNKHLLVRKLHVISAGMKGALDATGDVALTTTPIRARLDMHWQNVRLPPDLAGQTLATTGHLAFSGSTRHFNANGHLKIGPPGQPTDLTLKLAGTPQKIVLDTLTLAQSQGHLALSGTLDLKPAFGWSLQAHARHFNPGLVLAGWKGDLNADLATHGKIHNSKPHGTLTIQKLHGSLRQRQLHGGGKLELSPNRVVSGHLDLRSGSSRIALTGQPGARNDVTLKLHVRSLGDWLPHASGSLHGHFRIRGLWPALAVRGNMSAISFHYRSDRVRAFHLHADIPDISHPGGTLTVNAHAVAVGNKVRIDRLHLAARGNAAHHTLRLNAKGSPVSLELALDGSKHGTGWKGTLRRLDLTFQSMPTWHLQSPAQLAYDRGGASLSQLCLSPGTTASICLSGKRHKSGALEARYRIRALPLQQLLSLASNLPVRSQGTLNGQGHVTRSAKGTLTGQASITSSHGQFRYVNRPKSPLLSYRNLAVHANLSPQQEHVRLGADLNDGGRLDGDITVSGAQEKLHGQVGVDIENLGFLALFTDQVANVSGKLKARLGFAGTLSEPVASGVVNLENFGAEVPAAGIKLHDGRVHVATNQAGNLGVNCQITSGKGTMHLSGTVGLHAGTTTQLHMTGQHVQIADIPAASVTVSPDLTVKQSSKLVSVTGKVKVDKASANLGKLPGAGAAKASPDVVVVDSPQQQQKAQSLPLMVDVLVDLDSHTSFKGMGLQGSLHGQLRVHASPGHAATGQGQIIVDGTYKAYGQDLDIKQGRLLFASTPIDNPGLNIRAVRDLNPNATIDQGQEVGLHITGTAKNPQATVYSNPSMPQADALAYLVTGKPLSQVGSGQGSLVTSAAQSLGSAAGNLLAKSIGSQLGIADIGVSNSEALGGSSAFTVGKYLSPRLYLSYGVGLFEPGQVITLRYRLSHRWNFQAENATNFNRASFNYRYEK